VLDIGAGTGFLTMAVAGLGHGVTAVDLSGQMLARLTIKASAQQFAVTPIQARADQVPQEDFDVVMSRHLLWTLPDPQSAAGVAGGRARRSAGAGGQRVGRRSVCGRPDPRPRPA
jgi:2-polyprenyl-3-methyl-5-hydroxy-6-metoxy-1,4-benzoquinol methylase